MLNISNNKLHKKVSLTGYKSGKKVFKNGYHKRFNHFLLAFAIIEFLILLLPWTQNIVGRGLVTTLTPDQRPQTIQSQIPGRIEQWFVREGDVVKKGDRILIHAGSGGVGHFAIQIAKSLGAHVITTSSVKNKAFVLSLGADEFIDYRTQQFQDEVSNLDFVFDMFNGEILLNSVKVVREGGKIISLPTPDFSDEILGLAKERNVDVSFLMVHSNGEDMQTLATMLSKGAIKPSIFKTYMFENMAKAHKQQESGRTVGKIIITL